MSDYLGDYNAGATVVFNFNTASFSDGSPITLAGTPALSVYKNSTVESTTGITLTVDYDARTGMHHVVVDTSTDVSFYAPGNDFDVVITTGTVGGTSVVGRVVGRFSLANRFPVVRSNSVAGGGASSVTLDAGASAVTDFYKGCLVYITGGVGAGQARAVTGYNGTTKVATVTPAWVTQPSNLSLYSVIPLGAADLVSVDGTAISTSIAQIGVNLVNVSGNTAATDVNGNLMVDVEDWNGVAVSPPLVGGVPLTTVASYGLNAVLVDTKPLPTALAYIGASVAGKVSGAGTGTETFVGLNGTTTRLTVTVDANGNRSGVVYG